MSQFAHGIRSFDASSMSATTAAAASEENSVDNTTHVLGVAHRSASSLVAHLQSIVWLTYRKDFAQMIPYNFTSDAGWGCMLRSAQMLLCEALLRNLAIHADRRFQWDDISAELSPSVVQILRSFVDSPSSKCTFGLHRMVQVGMQYDMLPGEWYGPTTAAQVLRDLVNEETDIGNLNLRMYVPQDGVIYTDEVNKLCITSFVKPAAAAATCLNSNSSSSFYDPLFNLPQVDVAAGWTHSLLILVPLRLGLEKINTTYIPALTAFFSFPQSVGIIGGKRGHSVYFVGARGHQFHILDPHTVHPTPDADDAAFPTATHARTIHSTDHLVMEVDYIDPSLALGFLCKSRSEYDDLTARVAALSATHTCPISIAGARPDYAQDTSELHSVSGDSATDGGDVDDEDDYVLI
ncbi:hypothetical protein H310_11591 [Aphanomyces invadans]|uniref:Cysteine protease n=1 Tax=Aphanomyces invadans TaxID=157072 RepID=A0A024TLV3_9STRA|nr:hypothetical protein H310_11591 [Aphanomyces invadans]ETV94949.1 hypothetical protein H310_11591 [Aphanomyces invadans]|eukprot:XP_008876540.1 hypothetical protein H310_11591 [Aphanomyces invadans]